jgi:hypothetical protein
MSAVIPGSEVKGESRDDAQYKYLYTIALDIFANQLFIPEAILPPRSTDDYVHLVTLSVLQFAPYLVSDERWYSSICNAIDKIGKYVYTQPLDRGVSSLSLSSSSSGGSLGDRSIWSRLNSDEKRTISKLVRKSDIIEEKESESGTLSSFYRDRKCDQYLPGIQNKFPVFKFPSPSNRGAGRGQPQLSSSLANQQNQQMPPPPLPEDVEEEAYIPETI